MAGTQRILVIGTIRTAFRAGRGYRLFSSAQHGVRSQHGRQQFGQEEIDTDTNDDDSNDNTEEEQDKVNPCNQQKHPFPAQFTQCGPGSVRSIEAIIKKAKQIIDDKVR